MAQKQLEISMPYLKHGLIWESFMLCLKRTPRRKSTMKPREWEPVLLVFIALIYCPYSRTVIESLRRCPVDNIDRRHCAGSVLIQSGRYADALYFCQQWLTEKAVCSTKPPRGGTDFKAPHRNTMAVKKEKKYKHIAGGLLYSAALASFKHFGDCEQSRQYLKLATIAHPHVLVKILAKVKQPGDYPTILSDTIISHVSLLRVASF